MNTEEKKSFLTRLRLYFSGKNALLAALALLLQALSLLALPYSGLLGVGALLLLIVMLANSIMNTRIISETNRIKITELAHQLEGLEHLKAQTEKRIRDERSARITAFARRDSEGPYRHNLILVTLQRTGSTWLMDMLRTHPRIVFDPAAHLFEALQLEGNRYPGHLTTANRQGDEFEIQPGIGNLLPHFAPAPSHPDLLHLPRFALEKFHPIFIKDWATWEAQLAALQRGDMNFAFVYLVRDPKATLSSFFSYQQRARWYPDVDTAAAFRLYEENFDGILQMQARLGGLVIDYGDLRQDTTATMRRIYQHLWGAENLPPHDSIIQHGINVTRREKRSNSAFLGAKEGPVKGAAKAEYEEIFTSHAAQLAALYHRYEAILRLREKA